ncbi:hypothetical protein PV327_003341 [Microctonus hyperodae]|uniref:Uncharacterized protein n=1 Tax=Microctonus hyperodae TaxID=165561 RepID=A0AA39G3T7_MICHY|nr:hypothetical protein PV327_003341 [Microctonus hyperodae]
MTRHVLKNNSSKRYYENGIWKGPIINPPPDHYKYGEVLFKSMKKNSKLIGQTQASTGKEDSFGEMLDRSIRCALWLKKQNIKPGDVVGICTQHHLNHITPIVASLFIGSIINPWWSDMEEVEQIKYFIELTDAKVVFVSEKNASFIQDTMKKHNINIKIIVFGNVNGLESFDDILKVQSAEEVKKFQCETIESANKPAIIIYTSGTTGKSKGVLHSYHSVANNYEFIPADLIKESRGMCNSQIAWISGIVNPLRAIEYGSNIIITSDMSEADSFRMIEKYKASVMGTGTADRMSKTCFINSLDYSTVKFVVVGGAIVKKNVIEFMKNIFPNGKIQQSYGTTELGGIVTQTEVNHDINSCGRVLANIEIKVMSGDGKKILGPNEHGELYVKSSCMMLCYYKNPSATMKALDSENWYQSGDLGYYNESGEFFIIDRIIELIKTQSDYIAPGPIEEIIHRHPNVAGVAVIAKSNENNIEQPMTFVVKSSGTTVTEEEITNFVKENIQEKFHLKGGVKFIDKLPLTQSGKISKGTLREIAKRMAHEF